MPASMTEPSSQVPGIDALNCGIANVDLEEPLDATNNYWGSTIGPGADPADNAGRVAISSAAGPL